MGGIEVWGHERDIGGMLWGHRYGDIWGRGAVGSWGPMGTVGTYEVMETYRDLWGHVNLWGHGDLWGPMGTHGVM